MVGKTVTVKALYTSSAAETFVSRLSMAMVMMPLLTLLFLSLEGFRLQPVST
jgi:hypothetical protein